MNSTNKNNSLLKKKFKECRSPELTEFFFQLKEILLRDWKTILNELKSIEFDTNDFSFFEKNPSKFLDFLVSRSVTLGEIYDAFEALQIEDGLLLLGKSVTNIRNISKKPDSNFIEIKNGDSFELVCQAESFPKPSFSFYKNNIKLSSTNVYKVDKAK